jgi:spore coat polysaccharide biosynthesis protein SpsF
MNIAVITQARMGSSRLPGKVARTIDGKSLLEIHLNRIARSRQISHLIVATTINAEDAIIEDLAAQLGIQSFRGDQNDVLDRYYQAAGLVSPDYIVRVTSDCPLIDAVLMDELIDTTISEGWDYCSNTLEASYPDGQDIEIFTMAALKKAWNEATLESEREHVTPYIKKNSSFYQKEMFRSKNLVAPHDYSHIRMTVDEIQDYEMIKVLIGELGTDRPWLDYAEFLDKHVEVRSLNSNIIRDAGYLKSLKNDKNVR